MKQNTIQRILEKHKIIGIELKIIGHKIVNFPFTELNADMEALTRELSDAIFKRIKGIEHIDCNCSLCRIQEDFTLPKAKEVKD